MKLIATHKAILESILINKIVKIERLSEINYNKKVSSFNTKILRGPTQPLSSVPRQ